MSARQSGDVFSLLISCFASALKPGQVIQLTSLTSSQFVWVIWPRPALEIIRVRPGLNHMRCKFEKKKGDIEAQKWMPLQCSFLCATPNICDDIACWKCTESYSLNSCRHMNAKIYTSQLAKSHTH